MYRNAFIALAGVLAPLSVAAQTAPEAAPAPAPAAGTSAAPVTGTAPAPGAVVYDMQGGTVGTIASVDGTNAVVDTGTVKAAIPLASLGTSPKGPTLAMTKAQLEAAASQTAAEASANFQSKLTVGAAVFGSGGTQLGTIKASDAQFVTITTAKGDAKLPIGSFGPGPKGVTIGMTAAELDAAMGQK